jgi:hypothetical protein
MWFFLSARLRTWLLLAIALPLAGCLSIASLWRPNAMTHPPVGRNCSTGPTRQ